MDLSYLKTIDPVKGALGQAITLLVTAIYYNVVVFSDKSPYPKDCSSRLLKIDEPDYDFVIVGAGSSGSLLANRLTDTPEFKVLLVEAGDCPSATSEVPFLFFALQYTDEDWRFITTKEKYGCKGMMGERCIVSRGKVLGGTSTINNLHYYRGTTRDYDSWQFDEWSSAVIPQYFANLEKYGGKTRVPFDVGYLGNITLSYFKTEHFLKLPLSKMYKTAGYKPLSPGKYVGYLEMLVMSIKSLRMNMAKIFLSPIGERKNFDLLTRTTATRVIFTSPQDGRVQGIEVSIGKHKKYIRVKKEVILTGGPINNAKLLLMSGIGPAQQLEKNRIPVIANLAVGKNFQSHFSVPIFVAIDKCCGQCLNCTTVDCQNDFFDFAEFYQSTWDFLMDRIGYYTSTGINDFVAFIATHHKNREYPNIAIYHQYFKRNDFYLKTFLENLHYHPAVVASVLKHNKLRNIMVFTPTLLSPESRGEIYLNSSYLQGPPVVHPNYMSDEDGNDFNGMYSAVTMIVSLTDSLAMQRYKAKFLNVDIPNCRNLKFCSEYYFKCLIYNLGGPTSTVAGTAKMGLECQNTSVVNADLEVYKVRCLRIGDKSVVPLIGTSNMVSTDALLGERLADLLRIRWAKKYLSPYRKKEVALNIIT